MSRSTHNTPAVVLQLAAARGQDPGAALSRRVERALERVENALHTLMRNRTLFSREGGKVATQLLEVQESLLHGYARLGEARGDGPLPKPRKAETIAAIHEEVRESLAASERVIGALPPELVPPELQASVRPLRG